MLVSCNLLSLYLFLKQTEEQSTRNSLIGCLFLVVPNQLTGKRSDMVFLWRIYCVLLDRLQCRNICRNFLYIIFFSFMYTQILLTCYLMHFKCQHALTLDLGCKNPSRCVKLFPRSNVNKFPVEIIQLSAKFQPAIVSYLRFNWIKNSSDYRRV